jgi:hypothetical protein
MLKVFVILVYAIACVFAQDADQVLFGSAARDYLRAAATSGDVIAQAALSQDDVVERLGLEADLGYDILANNFIYACHGVAEPGVETTSFEVEVETANNADATPDSSLPPSETHNLHDIAVSPSSLAGPDAAEPPLSSTFKLHSRPSSRSKIYLDFDGHNTINSAWNKNRASVLVTPPYSLDADPAFSTAELQAITGKIFLAGAYHAQHIPFKQAVRHVHGAA